VIFDAVRRLSPARSKGSLTPDGIYLSAGDATRESVESLVFLRDLLEAGQIRPVIDRRNAWSR
jgi:hypothetical protein